MKILLLGGTGAMGIHLVDILTSMPQNHVVVTSRSKHFSNRNNLEFIKGNAKEMSFLVPILVEGNFDVMVDFMTYNTKELQERLKYLLSYVKQYVFLSSARIFDEDPNGISEESPRLLESCADQNYLKTDEYSLAKAREEDILKDSGFTNYTIVRPYITYSENRLQLGVLEKEEWLYRVLTGRSIVFSKDIADKYTTLTYGYDVALAISKLIGNKKSIGTSFNIMQPHPIKWKDVLAIYLNVLERQLGKRPKIVIIDKATNLRLEDRKWQVIYDRCLNRKFNIKKLTEIIGDFQFTPIQEGIEKSIIGFLAKPEFRYINHKNEALRDKYAYDIATYHCFKGNKRLYLKYLYWRFICPINKL